MFAFVVAAFRLRHALPIIAAFAVCSNSLAQSLGSNPLLASGSQTITSGNSFTGTFTVNNSTLYLGTNFTAPASTAFNFTGGSSYFSPTSPTGECEQIFSRGVNAQVIAVA